MASSTVSLLVAAVLVVAVAEVCLAQLCSHCECLPEPSSRQLCARQERTGKFRGFRSRCELDCSNRCRKDKYVFVANGRCGKYLATSTPPTDGGASQRPARGPVEGSVFGPLLQLLMQAAPSS
ncbi:Kazal peptide Pr13a-like [Schistocerca nitens]|uniref:Kazal peptide Pr13a-like n=1 Tax=Schistocerca nitens TaxID=7011 RepID=UPI00211759E5|nr:Kazal peptide Pr13a-like [Schistocerca nitens]